MQQGQVIMGQPMAQPMVQSLAVTIVPPRLGPPSGSIVVSDTRLPSKKVKHASPPPPPLSGSWRRRLVYP